eukprot:scaffold86615_cov20-Tisochrysis_lutea.AAC.4
MHVRVTKPHCPSAFSRHSLTTACAFVLPFMYYPLWAQGNLKHQLQGQDSRHHADASSSTIPSSNNFQSTDQPQRPAAWPEHGPMCSC